MNFFGINIYETINPYKYNTIPNFKKSARKKQTTYKKLEFDHFIYQMNIAQILQWTEKIENLSSVSISSNIFQIDFREKDEQNVFIMDKNKANIVEIFGNTKMKFLKKICQNCREYPAIYNEYFLTMYGLNFLRLKIPTFNFSYSFHKRNKLISVKQEFTEGESLEMFLTHCSMDDFYSVFLQVVISLEIAQKELLFTHYDLHLENILIEPIDKPFSMQVLHKEYTFSKYKIKIIDFGFSCVCVSPTDIFSNCSAHSLFQNGYFPFFTPGTDLFRFIGSLALQTSGTQSEFSLYIMENLYGIPSSKMIQCKDFLRNTFYNCSFLNSYKAPIYTIPLECLLIANSFPPTVLQRFGIQSVPSMRINDHGDKVSNMFLKDEFQSLFSLGSIYKQIDYNPMGKMYHGEFQRFTYSIPETVPLFLQTSLQDLSIFYEQNSRFLKDFTPSTNVVQYHKFYRSLSCIKQYLYFANHPYFRFSDKTRTDILKKTEPMRKALN